MQDTFFQELLKRKVFRGIALYVVVAWLIMQAAEIVLPAFDLPNWTLRVVIISLVAGLPIAALLSWAFDLSSQGLRRERSLAAEKADVGKFSRSIDFAIIGVLGILAAYFGWHYFTTGSAIPEAIASEPSIAVLPFVNMSDDVANEYFSDGISEELLNALAKVEGLKVAGRTSSFFYKGKDQDLRVIGEQLGVATVLEGSVRKAGDRVRVTAQLISTDDGFHLWSDTFDYQLNDIFEVQDKIAEAVVLALKGKLLGKDMASMASTKTTSPIAYAFYLQGRNGLHRRTRESIVGAETMFKQAIDADPDYAPAWVGLAESYMLQHINHQLISMEEAESKAEAAIQRALELDENLAEAYAALGLIRMEAKRYEEAETAFSRSLKINPNYPEALHWFGLLHRWRGEPARAREELTRSIALDPLHRVARANLAQLMLSQGDFKSARELVEGSISITPDYAANHALLAAIMSLGPMPNPHEAIKMIDQAIALEPDKKDFWHYKIGIQLELDDVAAARTTLAAFKQALPGNSLAVISEFGIRCYETGDNSGAQFILEQLQARPDMEPPFRNALLGMAHTIDGNFAEATIALEEMNPRLAADEPKVESDNLVFAKMLAIAYHGLGNTVRMEKIIGSIETHLEKSSRFGPDGYQLTDVEIAVLRGNDDQAMQLLQNAFDAGYRTRTVDGLWQLKDYPVFATLRERPDFRNLVSLIEQYHSALTG